MDVVIAELLIVISSAAVWWSVAPVLVSMGDKRLKRRNPDHHRKVVRFYRLWGFAAIAFGALISVALR